MYLFLSMLALVYQAVVCILRRDPEWLLSVARKRHRENLRLLELIKASFEASGRIYGSPRVFMDLRELGERCGKHRVARIMQANKIKAQRGYMSPRSTYTPPHSAYLNHLNRNFSIDTPDIA